MCRYRCPKKRSIAGGGNCGAHAPPCCPNSYCHRLNGAESGCRTRHAAGDFQLAEEVEHSADGGLSALWQLTWTLGLANTHGGTSRGLQRAMHGTQLPPLHHAPYCPTDNMPRPVEQRARCRHAAPSAMHHSSWRALIARSALTDHLCVSNDAGEALSDQAPTPVVRPAVGADLLARTERR